MFLLVLFYIFTAVKAAYLKKSIKHIIAEKYIIYPRYRSCFY